jgi:hypothetical protein
MILLPGASPTIKNCVIRNNTITAGNGGNGADADATHNAGRGGWGGWARGGAIYCASDTNPLFVNCVIENNTAQAGNGGNGGGESANGGLANYGGNYTPPLPINIDPENLGAEVVDEELWSLWEWDYAMQIQQAFANQDVSFGGANAPIGGGSYVGDYRWYSAYGGGVFLDERCKAEFVDCTIRGNQTLGGLSGQGGSQTTGRRTEPLIPFEMPSYGGGVYCAADTTVTFRNCDFANNTASVPAGGQASFRMDPYVGFGGGVAAEFTSSVLFVDCNFVDNEADTGGALYMAEAVVKVYDTQIATNTAIRGAVWPASAAISPSAAATSGTTRRPSPPRTRPTPASWPWAQACSSRRPPPGCRTATSPATRPRAPAAVSTSAARTAPPSSTA